MSANRLSFPESTLRVIMATVAREWGDAAAERVTVATAAWILHARRGGRVEQDELHELIANCDSLIPEYTDDRLHAQWVRSPDHPLAVMARLTLPPVWTFRLAPRMLRVGLGVQVATVRVVQHGLYTAIDLNVALPAGTPERLTRFLLMAIDEGSRWYLERGAHVRMLTHKRVTAATSRTETEFAATMRWHITWLAWRPMTLALGLLGLVVLVAWWAGTWSALALIAGVALGVTPLWVTRRVERNLLQGVITQYESLLTERSGLMRRSEAVTSLIGEHSAMLASARVVHEVSSPIALIRRTLAELESEGTRAELMPIREACERLARVSQLVRSPRRHALPIPMRMAPDGLIGYAASVAEPLITAAHGTVVRNAEVDPNLRVQVITDLLAPVIDNLVRNAVQAARPGVAFRLQIGCHSAGDRLILTLRDNGTGMSPSVAERAFTTLFTTKPDGLGLGLAMCSELCALQDAQISVEWTAEGEGTEIGIGFSMAAPSGIQVVVR